MTPRTLFSVFAFIFAYLFFAAQVVCHAATYNAFTVEVTGKGQPIILIPGATCSGDEWNETVARYSGKYQCHVITIAGYAGTKPMPDGPYLATVKDQLKQYIADNKLNNVILIGHSIGGFMSLWLASEMKDHLAKVVVVDAMPFFAGATNPAAPDTFSEKAAQESYERYSKMDDASLRANQLGIAKFMCLDSTRWQTIVNWGATSDKKTMAWTMTEMFTKDLRKTTANIHVPVLVLAAYAVQPQYPMYTREMVSGMFAEQYKDCKACSVHVSEGGTKHFIMYDDPKWYYRELDNFFAK